MKYYSHAIIECKGLPSPHRPYDCVAEAMGMTGNAVLMMMKHNKKVQRCSVHAGRPAKAAPGGKAYRNQGGMGGCCE